jgi:hypothetical protein
MTQKHLISCVCCGKRWIDIPDIGKACPWCQSSCVSFGPLPHDAVKALVAAGMPDFSEQRD